MTESVLPRVVLGDHAEVAGLMLKQARSGRYVGADDPESQAYRKDCMWWHPPTRAAISLMIDDSKVAIGGPRGWALHISFFAVDGEEGIIIPVPQDKLVARRWVEAVFRSFERKVIVIPPGAQDNIKARLSDQHTYVLLCPAGSHEPKMVDDRVLQEVGGLRFDDFFKRVS